MTSQTVHFIYDACKQPDADFAADLITAFGQSELAAAQYVVTIGGDGTLLHALQQAAGKKVIGLVAPGSNSSGFWTNKSIRTVADLGSALTSGQSYLIKPLQADIIFADGTSTMRQGYNDISICRMPQAPSDGLRSSYNLPPEELSVQSMLLNLRVAFANATLGPYRVMGSGLIFATPLGSTAMNKSNGGPPIDIRNKVIVVTGMGVSEPKGGFNSIVNHDDTTFTMDILSVEKRPVLVSYDSFALATNAAGSPINSVKIHSAQSGAVNIVLTDDPGTRAWASMSP